MSITSDKLEYRGSVLYADFSDSTPGEVGETPILYNERRDLSQLIDRNGGQTVEAVARRIVGLFPRAEAALTSARAVRGAVIQLRESAPQRRGLACRLLLGYGTVTLDNGRLRSDWTHRLPGLVSQVPEYAIAGLPEFIAQLPAGTAARALPGSAAIHLLSGADDEAADNRQTRHASTLLKADTAVFTELRLSVGGKPRIVQARDCPLLLGRDKSCGVMVSGDTASRVHGRIGYEAGKFFYADESRNGTYVLTAAGEELFLHNERVVLVGEGAISPGAPLSQQTAAVVRYICSSSRLAMADERSGDTRPLAGRKRP
ncbi:MAG: FHA domain-containing protein [Nevskiaceae bacterium]|nr:MAG: FHA domain-containing protein [Nevskiaceae bacterium]